MSRPDLSPALLEILHRRDEVARQLEEALHEYRSSNESEAILNAQYEREFAEAFLRGEGTQKDRECQAKLAAKDTYQALQMAIAIRRSGRGALDAHGKDMDALSAMAHAHNREMKVLGG